MNDRIAARATRWNSCSARAGRMLRSSPTIAPTNALTSTSNENWRQLLASPSLGVIAVESRLVGVSALRVDSATQPLGQGDAPTTMRPGSWEPRHGSALQPAHHEAGVTE